MEQIKQVVNSTKGKYIIGGIVALLAIYAAFSMGKKSAVAPEEEVVVDTSMATTTEEVATTTTTTTSGVKTTTTTAPKPAAPSIAADGSYIVAYYASGFSPKTITIKKGKSVRFINYSNKAMSITTTEPNNTVYREFNQSKTVGYKGTFDYTFLTAGTWNYQNRNNPNDRGTIVVQ